MIETVWNWIKRLVSGLVAAVVGLFPAGTEPTQPTVQQTQEPVTARQAIVEAAEQEREQVELQAFGMDTEQLQTLYQQL